MLQNNRSKYGPAPLPLNLYTLINNHKPLQLKNLVLINNLIPVTLKKK